jgi:hypothetical protein
MSLVGICRGFVLLVIMPGRYCPVQLSSQAEPVKVVMYYAKPYFTNTPPPPTEAEVATSGFSHASSSSEETPSSTNQTPAQKSSHLDLIIVRSCLLIEFVPYVLLATNVNSTTFVCLTACLTLGSPTNPAINSLALSLIPNSREAGRLFGGLSVLHTISASLISPLLFGTLFSATVGWYAPTVFALAAGILAIAQVFLAMVRLPGADEGAKRAERGRSRQVKTVR